MRTPGPDRASPPRSDPDERRCRRALVRNVFRVLDRIYGGVAWNPKREARDPLDALIRTILSQNTTDRNRDRAFDGLKERFSTWPEVARADLRRLTRAIRVAGLTNQKARTIRSFLRWLERERGDFDLGFVEGLEDEEAVELLTSHRGIGLKTAYIVLAFAFDRDMCAVDTHVHRVLRRVGVIGERVGRDRAHLELAELIPKGMARGFHLDLIDFGRGVCTARSPSCDICPITGFCSYYRTAIVVENE